MTGQGGTADREIVDTAARLRRLKQTLGGAYWRSDEARDLREDLRRLVGAYGAWDADKPPMHRRARIASRYESEYADLLWPKPM